MGLFAVSLALALAHDPESRSVNMPGTVGNARSVVAALAKAAGTKLVVPSGLDREIIGLASPSKPLKDSLDAIATAMDAKWVDRSGTLTLERPLELESKRKIRDRETKLAILREALAKATTGAQTESLTTASARKIMSDLKQAYENQPTTEKINAAMARTPAEQLMKRLLLCVKPEDLIEVRTQQRFIFSSAPNRLQKGFSTDIRPAIRAFVADQDAWSETGKEWGADPFAKQFSGSAAPIPEVSKVLMNVRYSQGISFGSMIFQAKVFNREGAMVSAPTARLAGVYMNYLMTDAIKEAPEELNPVRIPPTEGEKLFTDHISKRRSPQANVPIFPKNLEELLMRHDLNDPLAMVAPNALQTFAETEGKTVAAVVPDSLLFSILRQTAVRPMTLAKWREELIAQRIEETPAGNALALRPKMGILNDSNRTSRAGYTRYVGQLDSYGYSRLAPLAEYTHIRGDNLSGYDWNYLGSLGVSLPGHNAQWLRLFHLLTDNQKTALKRGDKLGMDAFSREQASRLHEILYQAEIAYGPAMEDGGPHMGGPWGEMGSISREPTEVFPNGIPAGAKLSLRYFEKPCFFAVPESSITYRGRMDTEAIAYDRFKKARPDLIPGGPEKSIGGVMSKKVVEGISRDWHFMFELAPNCMILQSLTDDSLGTKVYPTSQLPENAEREIAQFMKEYEARFKKGGIERPSGGGKIPPP